MVSIAEAVQQSRKDLQERHNALTRSFLETGTFSDFVVKCGTKEWKVHRVILCPQSEFFENALNGKFKENATNSLDLSKEDPIHLDRLIKCMYSYDIRASSNALLELVSLYDIAVRLLVPLVASLALSVLKDTMSRLKAGNPDNTFSAFVAFCKQLPAVVKAAWIDMPDENNPLRTIIIAELVDYSKTWNLKHESERLEEAFDISKTFAFDLLYAVDTREC